MISLIHDEKQVLRMEEICKATLLSSTYNQPGMLLCLNFNNGNKQSTEFGMKLVSPRTSLLNEIKRLEVKPELYVVQNSQLKEEDLNTTITMNPRSQISAAFEVSRICQNTLINSVPLNTDLDMLLLVSLLKAPEEEMFNVAIVRTKDVKVLNWMVKTCPSLAKAKFTVETEKGYYVAFQPRLEINQALCDFGYDFDTHNKIGIQSCNSYFTPSKNNQIPIPGTFHFGFPCSFVENCFAQ